MMLGIIIEIRKRKAEREQRKKREKKIIRNEFILRNAIAFL